MNKAFTLRLVRCLLVGLGAFVMILAVDITIRSPLDVAGYVLGAGGLWYVFEVFIAAPTKPKARPKRPPQHATPNQNAPKKKSSKAPKHRLGENHFD
ncbi:MAG: hypothetical protein HOH20_15840 [Rhodospirillaceae bacterium]|jgi:hypothetical protein|nr:hypothetical protein [Rhodospirillaceae bacterium]MBT5240745.1 hypothetical protein [Rhodospirillaceae bacterium]MBT5564065.1 hypothetical protein [Rhodospirillaceae bacterium]MBT6091045.1 hypothetical protein [Rhodospirillaceae bacterium]MBT6961116.1 hypothetical protein [Rhodospirillaceae bacterium]